MNMKSSPKSAPSLLAVCAAICLVSDASAALVYQWNFNSADGANSGSGTGGTLALDVGVVSGANGYASGGFSGAGVSGTAGDHALDAANAYDNYYAGNNYSPITNAAAVGTIDLTGLSQFTITMWVKRSGQRNVDLLNIGTTTTPGAASSPGISIGLDGNWANGVRVGVNGYTSYTGDLWTAGTDNDWCFLAFAYDGNGQVWWDPTMLNLYGADRNGAVITGDTTAAAAVAANLAMHIGDWGTAPGVPAVGATATMFLANDGANSLGTTNGFQGALDDIRIYNSLLPVSEIEGIRQSALIPEPSPVILLGFCGLGLALRRRH